MPILTIDGNIGCGKSTLLEYLHINYLLPIDLEPVNKWQPYLNDMYYHNKGACEFQVRVWLDRCWIQPKQETMILMERSPFFQQKVFIPINYEKERLTEREVNMLNEMYDKSTHIWNPFGYIYLRSNPDKCIERIKNRSRESEEAIDSSYIYRLHSLHEQNYFWAVANGYPMICIDVENKKTCDIAKEIIQVLEMMGVIFINGVYNSFMSNIKINDTKRVSYKSHYGTNNIIDINKTDSDSDKSVVAKLRDSSKAAYVRKKHINNSTPLFKIKTNIESSTYPQYTIYKKPITEGLFSASNIINIDITKQDNTMNTFNNELSKCTISELPELSETKSKYVYEKAFSDDSSTE